MLSCLDCFAPFLNIWTLNLCPVMSFLLYFAFSSQALISGAILPNSNTDWSTSIHMCQP